MQTGMSREKCSMCCALACEAQLLEHSEDTMWTVQKQAKLTRQRRGARNNTNATIFPASRCGPNARTLIFYANT